MAFQPLCRSLFSRVQVSRCINDAQHFRLINTSNVVFDSGPSFKYILKQNNLSEETKLQIESEAKNMLKDWLPFGYNQYDKYDDIYQFKSTMFVLTFVFTFGFAYQMWYRPRGIENDWARREAYLELERRRRDGLPLVDPNVIPSERVRLPSIEQLGPEFKLII